MSLSRGLLGLGGATALLFGLNLLAARPGADLSSFAAPLVDPTYASEIQVAAISIRAASQEGPKEFLYVRSAGTWRCATTLGAVADGPLLEALLQDFTGAFATQREAQDVAEFGFDDQALRVGFHGPKVLEAEDRDEKLAFELGRSLSAHSERERSFVRRAGSDEVFEVDSDPRALIAWQPSSRIPPLLDRKIIGGPWPGREFGFASVRIERADAPPLVLKHEALPGDPAAEGTATEASWRWVIEGQEEVPIARERVVGFTGFALRATWQGFANPAEARELGLLPPAAKIVLTPFAETGAEPIELLVGPPTPQGSSLLFHRQNKMLFVIDAETARLYAPTPAMWTAGEHNPWELWLSR